MLRGFSIFLFLIIISCDTSNQSSTYLGGGIVNPKDNFVVLSKDNDIVDSILIDEKGHFHFRFDLKEEGLFTFRHAGEPQMIYLKPKDSLRLRLNTFDFDESLTFSGEGSEENNFLIENFLINQQNSNLIFSYYKISPEEFEFKTDSIKKFRKNQLNKISKKYDFSDRFIEIANKSIDYEFFDMRERYAFLIRKYYPKKTKLIGSSFFRYRTDINYNDTIAKDLIIFRRFLDHYIKNQSILACLEQREATDCYDLDTHTNLDDRIRIVDTLITNNELRKTYFERFIQEEIILAENEEDLKHTRELIRKFQFAKDAKDRLESLVEFQSELLVNADLKNVTLMSKDLKNHKLKDIIKKKHAIIYAWSLQSPIHHKLRIKTIKKLKNKYEDIQFIGINIDYNFQDEWLTALNNYDDNIENEFTIMPNAHAQFYRNYLNKIFFINEDCTIKKSETVLSNQDLDGHIEDYLSLN